MNEVYQSEAYVQYATEQTAQTESYFGLGDGTATVDETDDTPSITSGGDDIKSVVENMLASSPIRGDENARFTIVEYTELLCPYCQRHSSEGTINAVIDQFPGEVNSISKSFIIH
jgi:protein-disulfide isomerase